MNYDLSKKSIYVLFHNYEVRIIEKVIKRFKNEPTSYSLLQQQFGPDLKGRTSMVFPNYMQMARLQTILARFEKILKVSESIYCSFQGCFLFFFPLTFISQIFFGIFYIRLTDNKH